LKTEGTRQAEWPTQKEGEKKGVGRGNGKRGAVPVSIITSGEVPRKSHRICNYADKPSQVGRGKKRSKETSVRLAGKSEKGIRTPQEQWKKLEATLDVKKAISA